MTALPLPGSRPLRLQALLGASLLVLAGLYLAALILAPDSVRRRVTSGSALSSHFPEMPHSIAIGILGAFALRVAFRTARSRRVSRVLIALSILALTVPWFLIVQWWLTQERFPSMAFYALGSFLDYADTMALALVWACGLVRAQVPEDPGLQARSRVAGKILLAILILGAIVRLLQGSGYFFFGFGGWFKDKPLAAGAYFFGTGLQSAVSVAMFWCAIESVRKKPLADNPAGRPLRIHRIALFSLAFSAGSGIFFALFSILMGPHEPLLLGLWRIPAFLAPYVLLTLGFAQVLSPPAGERLYVTKPPIPLTHGQDGHGPSEERNDIPGRSFNQGGEP